MKDYKSCHEKKNKDDKEDPRPAQSPDQTHALGPQKHTNPKNYTQGNILK